MEVEHKYVPGFERYCAGSDGSVWSSVSGEWKQLRPRLSSTGYAYVALSDAAGQKQLRVARVVLSAFRGPCPEGFEACHTDGNRLNNRLANLRWDTHSGNLRDRVAAGTAPRGVRNPNAKLTLAQVRAIRASTETHRALARLFGVNRQHIAGIRDGTRWQE